MTTNVEAFPTDRHAGRVARAADIMDRLTKRADAAFNRRVLLPLAADLATAGVSQADIAREVQTFEQAVVDEIFRRVTVEHEQPEGGAA
ncbi:DUF6074 family protein [Aureimonas phyllosphaerae]|uniref:DUF6074 family protein n=1 Tax=Aureimonas phyllosphaerae TaxID=1166078 RepID=UPI003A5C3B96